MNPDIEAQLDAIQREAFDYFATLANPANGLVPDSTREHSPASIATVGLALSAYPVGVHRGWMKRDEAAQRTLAALRFFAGSEQSELPTATGHKGFYFHFLNMATGQREGDCELSLIDSGLLLAGMLNAATFFDGDSAGEREIRERADWLYARADFSWALHGRESLAMGWKPECGFLNYDWDGYTEATILYILGLGAPVHTLPEQVYAVWTASYQWEDLYGREFLYAGPLFIHQFSHLWIDFRGIRDAFMRAMDSDYFENSRRATYAQRDYAIRNPGGFAGYGAGCFGTTAGEGPGDQKRRVEGVEKQFRGYTARGIPYGPDDGTISPWATLASLPFAPEIVLPTLAHLREHFPETVQQRAYLRSFNPSVPGHGPSGWIAPELCGLELGPLVLMIENHRSGFVWELMRRSPPLLRGLKKAGFTGGWL